LIKSDDNCAIFATKEENFASKIETDENFCDLLIDLANFFKALLLLFLIKIIWNPPRQTPTELGLIGQTLNFGRLGAIWQFVGSRTICFKFIWFTVNFF